METPADGIVHALGGPPAGAGGYLADLRAADGKYLTPVLDDVAARAVPAQLDGAGATIAVIDTGVLPDHPVIARAQARLFDVTGEGAEDQNGHGTIVALLALGMARASRLLSVRALDAQGQGTRIQMVEAFQVALQQGADIVNVSAGSYDPTCQGTCFVCEAVAGLAAAGLIVVAAAGNTPGKTDCPAKAGLYRGLAISVAAFDLRAGTIAWYSSPGEVAGPVGNYRLVPAS